MGHTYRCLFFFNFWKKMDFPYFFSFSLACYHMAAKTFQTFPEFSSHWPSQKHCFGFFKFEFTIFHDFFFFFVKMGPRGSKTLKRYSSLTSLLIFFQAFPGFVLIGPHKCTVFDFWNFDDFPCLFFSLSPLCHIGKPKTATISNRSYRRAKLSILWAWKVSIQRIPWYLDS